MDIILSDGSIGRGSVPSGASTGINEATEIRDGNTSRFVGMGVLKAVENVRGPITDTLHSLGDSITNQEILDRTLIDLDGTSEKSNMGANALLSVSMAAARAVARSLKIPLYAHLNGGARLTLPVPMLNILNGGAHAEGSTDIQEFMVVPAGFNTFSRALRAGVEIYHTLKHILSENGLSTNVGDEGGFAPNVRSNQDALELVLKSIEEAGYKPGEECFIAIDVAASELISTDGKYSLGKEGITLHRNQMLDLYEDWVSRYPIISIEDGLSQTDWDGWVNLTTRLGHKTQLVGDDLYTTNLNLIIQGISKKASNAVLVKLNQIGTVTETIEGIKAAKTAGWGTVISHRSGETEDTIIADLAVSTNAGQIKSGAPARGERTAKYNRLLRIEEELGDQVLFSKIDPYQSFIRH